MWHTPPTAVRPSIRPGAERPAMRRLGRWARWAGGARWAGWLGWARRTGTAFLGWVPAPGRSPGPPPRRAGDAAATMPLAAEDQEPREPERPLGCGWFDSSHDLRAGLQVQEHASADAVAQELPVDFWLQLHLAEWRGQPSA